MNRSFFTTLATLALFFAAAQGTFAQDTFAQDTKVLFLGNSYTAANDLPEVFQLLAQSGGHSVIQSQVAPGGFTLGSPQNLDQPHRSNPLSLDRIASNDWDFVVLQEQSVTPAIAFTRDEYMIPAVISLDAAIKSNQPQTTTLLYQTWARKDPGSYCWGNQCTANFASIEAMQDALTAGYDEAADAVGAQVAPVGEAWRIARQDEPDIELFDTDGAHPSVIGTYLAACVFYARIFQESPVGLSFGTADLGSDALDMQKVAARAVFGPDCGFEQYGAGSGASLPLSLTGTGAAGLGGTIAISPSLLPVGANGSWVLTSAAAFSLPLLGGELLVDPTRRLLPPHFVAAGNQWSITIPSDTTLTGVSVYFQALALFAGPPASAVFSGGLRLCICP